ncbi:MAG: hypothetical protein A3B53_00690 [Candidatus Levybacteria bacterium RIFCSPLOWO2_01_FULL_42_15]|nr:MAG: hypothetical protein A3B53_00690 [Candidatus Levybacteria bacterium RIFCSPLOWO2_01_FULL_42_15]
MQYNRTVLSNGLRVITVPMPSLQSATVLVMVGAGSRYETKQNNGISHFLEHMAFKGTKKRPSALAISTLVDGIGGEVNAFTGKETTGYYIKSLATHVDLSLDILSDMLQNSLFDKAEIQKERGVILEEINLYEDTPARKIGDVYEQALYGDTPMGWDIAGEKKIIRSINQSDFVSYLNTLYSPHNMVVVVAGGIDVEKTEALTTRYFGGMKRSQIKRFKPLIEVQSKPFVFIKPKKTEQVHIALGVRTVPLEHPHHYPLAVLSAILGGGMSSRLFHEVREKRGLAYYVRTSSDHYQDCGSLVSLAGVDAKRVDEAIRVIVEEYNKVKSEKLKVKSSELIKAKEFIKGHMMLELEDSKSVAGFYAHKELLERTIDNPSDVLAKIDKVELSDIEDVAKSYFTPARLNLAAIGNFDGANRQRFEKLLEL